MDGYGSKPGTPGEHPKMNRIVFMGMFTYPFFVSIGIDPPPDINKSAPQHNQVRCMGCVIEIF